MIPAGTFDGDQSTQSLHEQTSLINYINRFDPELFLNCMYVIRDQTESFQQFVSDLEKDQSLLNDIQMPSLTTRIREIVAAN